MTGGRGLRLSAPARERDGDRVGDRRDGAVLGRRIGDVRYTATAVIARGSLRGDTAGGLSSYKNANELIGVAADRRGVVVWQRNRGRERTLARTATPRSGRVHLRMRATGRRFVFEVSGDGTTWTRVGRRVRTPVTETTRVALTAGGSRRAVVRFLSASMAE